MSKPLEVEVILVGNELLKGERRDAHLAFIGRVLLGIGVHIGAAHVIGDDRGAIAGLVGDRLDDARVLIVAGGLGPTHDDVTREGVADGLGLELEYIESEWRKIQERFGRYKIKAAESNRRQAWFPKGATPIDNITGSAPGFFIEKKECLVAVLPGPPRELIPMMEGSVLERIAGIFERGTVYSQTFRTSGIPESSMVETLESMIEAHPEFVVSSLPHLGGVDIVVTQKPSAKDDTSIPKRAQEFEKELREHFGHKIYATGDASLEAIVGSALAERGETLAVAESLTGGFIGKRLTDIAGSSRYFLADVVAYSNQAKMDFLGVAEKTLAKHGAVSEQVCREMAEGVRTKTGATYGMATTGIAGPGGGSDEKPVGLTYFGIAWEGGCDIRHRVLPGDRESVRIRTLYAALFLLHQKLVAD